MRYSLQRDGAPLLLRQLPSAAARHLPALASCGDGFLTVPDVAYTEAMGRTATFGSDLSLALG
jgi:hypothetical protein